MSSVVLQGGGSHDRCGPDSCHNSVRLPTLITLCSVSRDFLKSLNTFKYSLGQQSNLLHTQLSALASMTQSRSVLHERTLGRASCPDHVGHELSAARTRLLCISLACCEQRNSTAAISFKQCIINDCFLPAEGCELQAAKLESVACSR